MDVPVPGVIGVQSSRACALHIAAKSQTGRANRAGQQKKSGTAEEEQDDAARTTTKEERDQDGK